MKIAGLPWNLWVHIKPSSVHWCRISSLMYLSFTPTELRASVGFFRACGSSSFSETYGSHCKMSRQYFTFWLCFLLWVSVTQSWVHHLWQEWEQADFNFFFCVKSLFRSAGIWPCNTLWIKPIGTGRGRETRSGCSCVILHKCQYLLPNTEREASSSWSSLKPSQHLRLRGQGARLADTCVERMHGPPALVRWGRPIYWLSVKTGEALFFF